MWNDDIARQRGPLGPERSIWACLTSSKHEICQISIKWTDLVSPQALSYGFPDDPAAILRSKLIIYDTTQDESSNEHIDPDI